MNSAGKEADKNPHNPDGLSLGIPPGEVEDSVLKELVIMNMTCKRSYALGTTLSEHTSQFMTSLVLGVAFEHYGFIRGKDVDFHVLAVSLTCVFFFSKLLTYVDFLMEKYPHLSLGWYNLRMVSQLFISYALFMAGRILSDYIFPMPSTGAWSLIFVMRPMVILVPLQAAVLFIQHLMDPSPFTTFKRRAALRAEMYQNTEGN